MKASPDAHGPGEHRIVSAVRGMAASAVQVADVDPGSPPHVEDREVRVVPFGDAPLGYAEQRPRVVRRHAHGVGHPDRSRTNHLHDHRHGGLHPGYARRCGIELLLLLLRRMRRMIRADHVELSLREPPKQLVPGGHVAYRRVDLVLRPREAVYLEQEVVQGDLRGEPGGPGEVQPLRGGQMAYVDVGPSETGGETGDR